MLSVDGKNVIAGTNRYYTVRTRSIVETVVPFDTTPVAANVSREKIMCIVGFKFGAYHPVLLSWGGPANLFRYSRRESFCDSPPFLARNDSTGVTRVAPNSLNSSCLSIWAGTTVPPTQDETPSFLHPRVISYYISQARHCHNN
jgi:hypothetical protein